MWLVCCRKTIGKEVAYSKIKSYYFVCSKLLFMKLT